MLDEFRSTSITWDKATRRIYSPITANGSDSNGRKLNIQVVNSGQVENLTGATLHLYWETKDKAQQGLDAFTASNISKGEFEIFYTTGMLSNVGELNATLVLVDATGQVVSDWFKITVARGIDGDAIQSENSFTTLTQALIDISNLEQNYAPRLNELTAQLQHIGYSITKYPRLALETDDCDRVLRAVADIPDGSTLFFPNGTYDFAGRTLPINKSIRIIGQSRPLYDDLNSDLVGGTIFLNTIVRFQADNIHAENLGVQTTMSDSFQANSGAVKGIRIKNCISKSVAHGFLFESYNGLVDDVICEDCESHDSTHGFIAKARRVKFINCRAYNHSTNGFAWISDNIPGASNTAISKDGLGENCYAENCQFGYNMYSRDYFSTTNANGITMSMLDLIDCTAKNCIFATSVGDPNSAPSGQTYNEVTDVNITNFKEISGAQSISSFRLQLCKRVNITAPNIEKTVSYDRSLAKDINFENPMSATGSLGNIEDIQSLEVNSPTPRLNYLGIDNLFKTANTQSTVITGFLSSRKRGTVMILIDDDYTTILNNANIVLKRNRYEGKGSWVVLKYDNTKWNELYGFNANKKVIIRNLDTATGVLEIDRANSWDVQFSSDTTKRISFSGSVIDDVKAYVLVRKTTAGTGTYGGLDPNILNQSGVRTSMTFGTAQMIELIYFNSLGKWAVVNTTDITYA